MTLLRNAPEPARRRLSAPPPELLHGPWEVDVVPVPGTIDNDAAARTVLVMLVVGGFVVAAEMENRPSEEPHALAALMAREIVAALERTAAAPPQVFLRHATLADPLQELLQPHGIRVAVQHELPALDEALRSLLGHLFHGIASRELLRSQPETWAGWGMPAESVKRKFAAAASYSRAAPWQVAADERPILVSRPGEREWTVLVLGAAGEQSGLTCYEQRADLEQLYRDNEDPTAAFSALRGKVIALLFNRRQEIPKRMREEIKAARWDVAAADAYPTLLVLNTPGGGIRIDDFTFLTDALLSVPKFVAKFSRAFSDRADDNKLIVWTDADTGLTCRLEPSPTLVDPLETYGPLKTAGPEGEGATPGATIDPEEADTLIDETVSRFYEWMRDPSAAQPLGDATAHKHAENAQLFASFCAHANGRPITAVTEFDLRTFLYDWYPSRVLDSDREAPAVLVSLRRFFGFLRARDGVHCPWASPILKDKAFFEQRWHTCPEGFSSETADQDWLEPLSIDLVSRALVPLPDDDDDFEFGETMGVVEQLLVLELHNQWLVWRDETIRGGVSDLRGVLEALQSRQRAWLDAPLRWDASSTPRSAIAGERKAPRNRRRR